MKSYLKLFIMLTALLLPVYLTGQLKVLEEGFETTTVGTIPDGWIQEHEVGQVDWTVETKDISFLPAARTGTGRILFSAASTVNAKTKLITPRIPIRSEELSEPLLRFYYANEHYAEVGTVNILRVYCKIIEDENEDTEWQEFGVYPNRQENWAMIEIDLSLFRDKTIRIAFEGETNKGRGIVLDDIEITNPIFCSEAPTNLMVTNITNNSAFLSWGRNDAAVGYYLILSKEALADPENSGITPQSVGSGYAATQLDADTRYYFYVKSDCGDGDESPWSTAGIFTTECLALTELHETFDTYTNVGTGKPIGCWNKFAYQQAPGDPPALVTSSTSNYIFHLYQGVARSGSIAVRAESMTNGKLTESWLVSPMLDLEALDLKNSQLSFWMNVTDSHVKLRVGFADTQDGQGFEEVGNFNCTNVGVYENKILPLNNYDPGDKKYLCFLYKCADVLSSNKYVYIDDIELQPLNEDCDVQITTSYVSTTHNSAVISWNPYKSSTKWNVKVSHYPINPEVSVGTVYEETNTSSPNVTVNSLNAGKPYYYYIQSVCEDGTAGKWSEKRKFITDCASEGITLFPFVEDFDEWTPVYTSYSYNTSPQCWKRANSISTTVSHPYVNSGSRYSGTHGYYFNGGKSTYAKVMTPKIGVDITKLQIRFQAKSSAGSVFVVGLQDDDDPWEDDVHPMDTIKFTDGNFKECIVSFESYIGANKIGKYIVLMNPYEENANKKAVHIDDVIIEYITEYNSACHIVPTGLEIAKATDNSVTLSWTATREEESWEVAYGLSGFYNDDPANDLRTANDTSIVIGTLLPNKTYDFYVRSVCDNGEKGTWVGPVIYATPTTAVDISTNPDTPYFADFENEEDAVLWKLINGTTTNKWHIGSTLDSEGNNYLFVSGNGYDNNYANTAAHLFAYRILNITQEGLYDFAFSWKAEGEKYYHVNTGTQYRDFLRIYLVPDSIEIKTGDANGIDVLVKYGDYTVVTPKNWIEIGDLFYLQKEWNDTLFNLIVPYAGKYKLLFYWKNDASSNTNYPPAAAIDNISFGINTGCMSPHNVKVKKINDTYAELEFFSYNTEEWDIKVSSTKLNSDNPGPADIHDEKITKLTFPITGLQPETTYYYYIKASCEDTWTNGEFTTHCARVSVPFFDDFNSYETGIGTFPTCWTYLMSYQLDYSKMTDADFPYINSMSYYGAGGSLHFKGNTSAKQTSYLVFPRMDVEDLSKYEVSFFARVASLNDTIIVGILEDADDYETFFPIERISPLKANNFEEFNISLEKYTGESKYIAFKTYGSNSSSSYIDNVEVDLIPSCRTPKSVEVSDVTERKAKFSWEDPYNSPQYRLKIATKSIKPERGDAVYDEIISGKSIEVDLRDNTQYYYYLQAVCDVNDRSKWTQEKTFTTPCIDGVVGLPYRQSFDSVNGRKMEHIDESCMKLVSVTSHPRPSLSNTSSSSVYHSSPHSVIMGSNALNRPSVLATPKLNVDRIQDLRVSFMGRITSSSTKIIVGVMTDVDDINTFVRLDTLGQINGLSTFQPYLVKLSDYDYEGDAKHFVFSSETTNSNSLFYLDDIVIQHDDLNCPVPYDLTATGLNADSAAIGWNNLGYWPNSYKLKVSRYPIDPQLEDGDRVIEDILANRYVLKGLEPSTTYYVYAQSVCNNDNNYNYWSQPVSFTTTCGAAELSVFEDFLGYGAIATSEIIVPDCWNYQMQLYSGLAATYSNPPTITVNNGDTVLLMYVYASGNNNSIKDFASPLLKIDDLQKVQMSFKYRSSQTRDLKLYVGYSTDFSDMSNFQPLDTVNTRGYGSDEWHYGLLNFKAVSEEDKERAKYLVFRLNSTDNAAGTSTSAYLDSILIEEIPACPAPYSIKPSVNKNTVSFKWKPGDDTHTSWDYVLTDRRIYVDSPDFLTELILYGKSSGTVTEPYCTIDEGLDQNTDYYFYIVTTGCDNYYPGGIRVTTECLAIEVPYFEDFESYNVTNGFPGCWTRYYAGGATRYPNISDISNHYTKAMTISASSYCNYSYAATNEIESSNIRGLRARFKALRDEDAYESLEVGIMSNPADTTTFKVLETVYLEQKNKWHIIRIPFTEYEYNGKHLAFMARITNNNDRVKLHIDDLHIEEIPECELPVFPKVAAVGINSLTVAWNTLEPSDSWEIVYGPAGFDLSNYETEQDVYLLPAIQDSIHTIDGLDDNTMYDVYVRTDCGIDGKSVWSEKVTAYTSQIPAQIPFYADFEEEEDDKDWTFINGKSVNYWIIGNAASVGDGERSLYITNDGLNNTYNVTTSERVNVYAYRTVYVPAGIYHMSYKGRAYGENFGDALRGYIVPASTVIRAGLDETSTWTPIGAAILETRDWVERTNYNGYESSYWEVSKENEGLYNVAFHWKNDMTRGTQPPGAVDSIVILPASCPAPKHFKVTNVTENSVNLNWVSYNADSCIVKVSTVPLSSEGLKNDVKGDKFNDTIAVASLPLPVTGLEPGTKYYYYIQSKCNDEWSSMTFTTKCAARIPIAENFDTYGTGANAYMDCWTKLNEISNDDYPYIGYSGSLRYLTLRATTTVPYSMAIAPELKIEGLNMDKYYLTFTAKSWSSFYPKSDLIWGFMDNPSDMETFVAMDTIELTNYSDFDLYYLEMKDYNYDLNKRHLAFLTTNDNGFSGLHIDDFRLGCLETETHRDKACAGYPYEGYGFVLSENEYPTGGNYTFERKVLMDNGCDSIITLELLVHETQYTDYNERICEGGSYSGHGFNNLTEAGDDYLMPYTSVLTGCDSIIRLKLTIDPNYEFEVTEVVCPAVLPFMWRDKPYEVEDVYYDSLETIYGCDSVYILNLVIVDQLEGEDEIEICAGEVYEFGTQILTKAGEYEEIFPSKNGCDSVVTLNLIVHPTYNLYETVTICYGTKYTGYGFTDLAVPNEYSNGKFQSINGCDSVFTLNLIITDQIYTLIEDTICQGEVYNKNGFKNITTAGAHPHPESLKSVAGCDSTVTLILYIAPTYNHEDELTISKLPHDYNGHEIPEGTLSGKIPFTFESIYGCDSIVTLDLTVLDGTGLKVHNNGTFHLIPNPVKLGEKVYIDYEFTPEESEGLRIEVLNMSGSRIADERPSTQPINIGEFIESSGVYMIKVTTGTNRILTGKLIVL